MSTTVRIPPTKLQRSRLVLEAACSFVVVTLLAWLLIWFANQQPQKAPVVVLYQTFNRDDLGHVEADARALAPKPPTMVDPDNLSDQILQKLDATPPPRVLVLSAPVLGKTFGGSETIEQVVTHVAGKARKDLLIVLDLSRVDTDRALHVYGNSPYAGLKEALKKVEMKENGANVAVLCSAAPGQVSWAVDGIGRSVFSYFLQRGLAGEARLVPDPAARRPRPVLTPDGVHRYVNDRVRAWARVNRKTNQNPELFAVGISKTNFKIPALDINRPKFAADVALLEVAEAKEKDVPKAEALKDKESEKEKKIADKPKESPSGKRASTPVDPREEQLDQLITEWTEHDKLAKREPPPYRYVPTLWRAYQDELLRADRLLRAGWADPVLRENVDDRLNDLGKARAELETKFQTRKKKEDEFRFSPALNNREGSNVLNAALKYVTDEGITDLIVEPDPPAPAPEIPAKPAGLGNGAGEVGRRPGVAGRPPEEVPGPLREALKGNPPARFLELQLLAYAHDFAQSYNAETLFKSGARSRLLRDAVKQRLPGEFALAVDRRGLDMIHEPIKMGDKTRRKVQDALLGGSIENLENDISAYGGKYNDALGLITEYHASRTLLERIAAEFPGLAEWKIRSMSRTSVAVEGGLPQGCDKVVSTVRKLADALEAGHNEPDSTALNVAHTDAKEAFELLNDEFKRKARGFTNGNWRDLDDILRVPLVEPELRKKLLNRVVRIETELPRAMAAGTTDASTARQTSPAPDDGFRPRAIWLARLEADLYSLAFGTHPITSTLNKLEVLKGDLESPPVDDPNTLADLLDLTARVSKGLKELSNEPGLPDPTTETGKAKLEAADLLIRFRPPTDLSRDEAVARLDDYARRSALEFHASRLNEDYADTESVQKILLAAKQEFKLAPNPQIRLYEGSLKTTVETQPLAVKASRKLEMTVRLDPQPSRSGLQVRDVAPEGHAFVGVSTVVPPLSPAPAAPGVGSAPSAPPRLIVSEPGNPSARFLPIGLAGGLIPVPKSDSRIAFEFRQVESAINKGETAELRVRSFYRGRLDDADENQKAALLNFGEDLKIKLRQNKQALANRFGEKIAKSIGDQFAEHPDRGYFHEGERIDFDVVIENISPGPLRLKVKRTYTPEAGEGKTRTLIEESRELKSREEWPLIGSVTAEQAPLDKPIVLKLEVFKEGVTMPQTEKFGFEQMKVNQYITVTPRPGEAILNGKRVNNALNLDIKRRADDRCPDPIFFKDIEATAGGKEKKRSLSPADYLDRDETVEAGWPIEKTDTMIDWTAAVGKGTPFTGKHMIK